ncbi:PadR family transcriptional regulator (plasmid) [Natrinema zhouii]|uniref:PadR family transcriptional regulator n=1 Tax=Natrinema zhouii TaxID=1710539 RepID=UPI001CFF64F1|nr:PadR family transcriptional regulator [Natrinema zhouii]UHQ98650.1 PadR family transcriptional regulator [Natrinema zhouii]
MTELTGFQRDLLYEIAAAEPAKGVTIKDKIEDYYRFEVNHGRLYPNLDTLVNAGLVEKGQRDRRTNESLTTSGEALLEQRREWEAGKLEQALANEADQVRDCDSNE